MKIYVIGHLNKRAAKAVLKCAKPMRLKGGKTLRIKKQSVAKAKKPSVKGGRLRGMINYSDRF